MGDTTHLGIPEYGFAVIRHRLLGAFERTAPAITLIAAPGGYGKTVLATQFAYAAKGDCLWLRMGGCSPGERDFPAAVAAKLNPERSRRLGRADALPVTVSPDSGWEYLESQISELTCKPDIVVLDGFDVLETTRSLVQFISLWRGVLGSPVKVVCTCRDASTRFSAQTHDESIWTIAADDLVFDVEQTSELASHVLNREVCWREAELLNLSSGAQPALLVLLLRHVMCQSGTVEEALTHRPNDVGDYLRRGFIDALDTEAKRVLGVAALLGSGSIESLETICDLPADKILFAVGSVPLLRIKSGALGAFGFEMHDLAAEFFGDAFLELPRDSVRDSLEAVVRELQSRGDFRRLFAVLAQMNDMPYLVREVELLGGALLENASLDLLESLLAKIPASVQAGSARLLLLGAMSLRCKGRVQEALERASSARSLAAVRPNPLLERDCLLVEARLRIDACQFEVLIEPLLRAFEVAQMSDDDDTAALISAYLATSYAQLGEVKEGRAFVEHYRRLYRHKGVLPATRAQSVSMILLVLGIICGDIASAAAVLKQTRGASGQPLESRLLCEGNLAALLLEMGRTQDSLDTCRASRLQAEDRGFTYLSGSFLGTEAAATAGYGDLAHAECLMAEAIESACCPDDASNIAYNRVYRATIRRSCGMLDAALIDSEQALVVFSQESAGLPIMACLARSEVAASMLALGDLPRARSLAAESAAEAATWTAAYHLLRADMVLAEIERQEGDVDAAIARMAQHRDYIATESANWQIAMYIRAFPGLLGVLTSAIGVETLPSHMLRMVLPEYAHPALDSCDGIVPKVDLERLAVRLLGKRAAAVYLRDRTRGPKATVRLFGGMEVVTPSGPVTDKDWRKRKARLLFALLVLRRGQDMPREQVFDHFWPEMDENRAKSNFYVTWSIMKRALGSGGKDHEPSPYVEHVGGVCRIVPSAISSDYAEFEDALAAMRKADRAGDAGLALASAERIAEQYRGELLPGELYDDWLSPIRDRCRQDYGDAMLRAAQLCHSAGDTEKALHLVRAGLGQDPWREDLYQGALRYLIHSGQRSGAIETYVACKSKLAEDLGLDPSSETQRLYDQILAMEDPPSAPAKG